MAKSSGPMTTTVLDIRRYATVVCFGLRLVTKQLQFRHDTRALGNWMCDEVAHMGPLFVKLGQFASSRKDVIDPYIAEALARLQDSAPKFDLDVDFQIDLEARTGGRLQSVHPIACASVAAVFRGTFQGQKAVFKVLRPGIRDTINSDIYALSSLLSLAERLGLKRAGSIRSLVKECEPMLLRELDMTMEAKNLRTFRSSLSDIDWVRVPAVFYDDADVLVMEYLRGKKVTDVEYLRRRGIDASNTASKLMMAFTIQVLRNGIFHADPHPGNVGIGPSGELLFYDLGSMIRIRKFRPYFLEFARAAATEDVSAMMNTMESMQIVKTAPGAEGRRLLRGYVREILRYMRSGDARLFHDGIVSKSARGNNGLNNRGDAVGRGVNLDWRFVYLSRAMTMVEGSCKELDPDFSYAEFLKILMPSIKMRQGSYVAAMTEGARVISGIAGTPRMIRDLSEMIEDHGEATSNDMTRARELSSRVDTTNVIILIILAYVAIKNYE